MATTNFQFDLYNEDGQSYIEFTTNEVEYYIYFDNHSSECDLLRRTYLKYDSIDGDDFGFTVMAELRKKLTFKTDPHHINCFFPVWKDTAPKMHTYTHATANAGQREVASFFKIPEGSTLSE